MQQPFTMSAAGRLEFGDGRIEMLPEILSTRGWTEIVLIVGRTLLASDELREKFFASLERSGVVARTYRYDRLPGDLDAHLDAEFHEASPEVVDAIVAIERGQFGGSARAVVAVGGGSAVDAGKAVSAALAMTGSIADYLEGVGSKSPDGRKLPFVAVPTTAGTGSEASKNAVMSRVGEGGFKKSLRHDNFVPDVVIVDPQLHLSCPRSVTAASGMDAITQLIEGLTSTSANPLTDALALDGLRHAGQAYVRSVEHGETDIDARASMAYASYLSGRCLANAGLGLVHGLAGPAGARIPVPHGVFCGSLLLQSIRMLVDRLRHERGSAASLVKLSAAGRALVCPDGVLSETMSHCEGGVERLIARVEEFDRVADFPKLSEYGLDRDTAKSIAAEGNSKNSPYQFTESDRLELLESGL